MKDVPCHLVWLQPINKKIPCVYLQNSGLGNATDPITNLISKEIYNLPLLMIIG